VVVVAASLMSLAMVENASRTPVEFIVICSRRRANFKAQKCLALPHDVSRKRTVVIRGGGDEGGRGGGGGRGAHGLK
jgi:hypothetical protein